MDMDSAAVFLAGSILYALGLLIILGGIIIANNLIHKFWKTFGWKILPSWFHEQDHTRFATEEELKHLDKNTKSKP